MTVILSQLNTYQYGKLLFDFEANDGMKMKLTAVEELLLHSNVSVFLFMSMTWVLMSCGIGCRTRKREQKS
jgi:hypothetical protein